MDILPVSFGGIREFLRFTSPVQLQLLSLFFLVSLEVLYFSRKKLPILSTRTFIGILVFALVFVITDIAVILVSRITLPKNWGLRLASQIRLYAYLNLSLCLYLYITFLQGRRQHVTLKDGFKIFTVYGIGVLAIIGVNFFTKNEQQGLFGYNVINTLINVISFLYAALTIIETIDYSKKNQDSFFRGKRRYIFITTTIWIIIVIIQIIQARTAISCIGIVSMCLLMHAGLETPDNYIDHDTETMNSNALRFFLQDYVSHKRPFFIINIDIEDYESIEEQFGDEIATALVKQVCDFVSKSFTYTIFHPAQNSITLAIPKNKKIEHSLYIDSILKRIQERLEQSWTVEENSFYLSSHCDFIIYPNDLEEDIPIHEFITLIHEWHLYSNDTGFVRQANASLVQNRKRHTKILKIIRDAVDKQNGIEMYYQPIYDIENKKFTNFEALVRLKDDKTLGYVSPEEFIPLAEKNGLIMRLSDNIFNQVFNFVSSNSLSDKGVNHIEVNLSGLQSVDAALPSQMSQLLKKYGLNPSIVNLEITESIAITSSYMLKKNMTKLKKIGCTFSMDDFGTGYSNLSQMAQTDYELIKIDKSLLWPCFDNKNPVQKNAKIILENMITMILNLGKKIVVEGVETKEQLEYLEKLGVTFIQGYYFSKPLPADEFLKFLDEHNN
ncbi:MAG: EAL domain-containing protein [Treponema sp.]|nr:EAL domain-containing protein [Treponema sp.]